MSIKKSKKRDTCLLNFVTVQRFKGTCLHMNKMVSSGLYQSSKARRKMNVSGARGK